MHATKMLLTTLIVAGSAAGQSNTPITPPEFERLHREIRPRDGEAPWAAIPWMYDLNKARQKAAAEGKPLCIWRMAGDPTAIC